MDAVGTSTVSLGGGVGYRALKGYGAAKNAADDETRGPDQERTGARADRTKAFPHLSAPKRRWLEGRRRRGATRRSF